MSTGEWTPVIVAAITAVGGGVAAWFSSRAGARKEQHALEARVKLLEENEPADLKAAREDSSKALEEAATADENARSALAEAKRANDRLDEHLEEERARRRDAREVGQARDRELAAKVEKLAEKVTTQGAQLELLLDGRVDTGGGSRRGR